MGIQTGKQRGNFTFGLNYYEESDTYDPNDLGFLRITMNDPEDLKLVTETLTPVF